MRTTGTRFVLTLVLLTASCSRDVEGPSESPSTDDPIVLEIDLSARPKVSSCSVHNEELHADTIPVVYGLSIPPIGYYDALENQFPYANSSISGGCVVSFDRRAETRYCPTCREAEAAWWDANHRSKVIAYEQSTSSVKLVLPEQ